MTTSLPWRPPATPSGCVPTPTPTSPGSKNSGPNISSTNAKPAATATAAYNQLARLISTHWTTQTVPEATLILIGLDETQVGFTIQLRCQRHIHMHPPQLSLWQGNEPRPTPLSPVWTTSSEPEALWQEQELTQPVIVQLQDETTIRLVWRGETWPTFTVVLTGNIHAHMIKSQTLGAACAVTVVDTMDEEQPH